MSQPVAPHGNGSQVTPAVLAQLASGRCWALASAVIVLALTSASAVHAIDRDGTDDCARTTSDFGDAPEGVTAYSSGVIGKFPSCLAAGPVGNRTKPAACVAISTLPAAAGYVRHDQGINGYWLGCSTTGLPLGIDTETDALTSEASTTSTCSEQEVDCTETAFSTTFGQDECYGDNDAGISTPIVLMGCSPSTITFSAHNCATTARTVVLNVLVDFNGDGDWNDGFSCGAGSCVYEWAVKNVTITLAPGCNTLTSPSFVAFQGSPEAWLRISLSDAAMPDDFPWRGSAGLAGGIIAGGETEDYPIAIQNFFDPCGGFHKYDDWGDAPEGIAAYPSGVIGRFPTCLTQTPAGTQETSCASPGTAPGLTGYVRHDAIYLVTQRFWLGCGDPPNTFGVDNEDNGITAVMPSPASACDNSEAIQCSEVAFVPAVTFGQDECTADGLDAGIDLPLSFATCAVETFQFNSRYCGSAPGDVVLNICIDWNEDGDWNDTFDCGDDVCAKEWAVKNQVITLAPGCNTITTPAFQTGPRSGFGWLRITLTPSAVPDDFPWNGSKSVIDANGQSFRNGETEDYPVVIRSDVPDSCLIATTDFGDAPEGIPAYPSVTGHFPTCLGPSAAGNQSILCGVANSTAPGLTGFVRHVNSPTDPSHFRLGCFMPAGETDLDGKVNTGTRVKSACDTTILTDCFETSPLSYSQDECTNDGVDAGVTSPISFLACSTSAVTFDAWSCGTPTAVYLNVLVDMDRDGDWNDNAYCPSRSACAPEWAVKNHPMTLTAGCANYTSPVFRIGPYGGTTWVRITLTTDPVGNDFPWKGGEFVGGETEDYPANLIVSLVGVEPSSTGRVELGPAFPNPSSDRVTLQFSLPHESDVTIAAYDITGRRLRTLRQGRVEPGVNFVDWNYRDDTGEQVPTGLYLIRMETGGRRFVRAVVRVR